MFQSPILNTIWLAMTPVGELRLALPVALAEYKLAVPVAFAASFIGNMIPVIAIIYLLEPTHTLLSRHSKIAQRFFEWLFSYTRRKHSHRFETLGSLALVIFVAIPLPMTGGWSGALAAFVFGVPPRVAIPLVGVGVAIAGVIVTVLTKGAMLAL